MGQIGPSLSKNSLSIRFMFHRDVLPISIEYELDEKVTTITPCLYKNYETFCPPWRINITKYYLRLKSKDFQPLRQRKPLLTEAHAQQCHVRRLKNVLLPDHKQQDKNIPKSSDAQCYCELCKHSGVPKHKYKLHSSKFFFEKSSYHASVK